MSRPRLSLALLLLPVLTSGCTADAPDAATPTPAPPVAPSPVALPTATPTPRRLPLPTPQPEAALPPSATPTYAAPARTLRLPAPPSRRAVADARVAFLKGKLAKFPTFTHLRQLAERYVQLGMFQEAATTYRQEAAWHRREGLIDAAQIVDGYAARYETKLQAFGEGAPQLAEVKKLYTGARLEPLVGCYIGAYIDRDESLRETFWGDNWQTHRRPEAFARQIGKPHGSYFTYVRYGNVFPSKWLEAVKRANAIPHIAWEPPNLSVVRDDAYLQNFAKRLGALNWPVWVRFAGEMNGDWTPYHGNPALYRQKFRLVNSVLHRYAPKVATIWCVGAMPFKNIQAYYPGDDGCDWVGLTLYSVPFYDNDPKRVALQDSPLALLDPIYNLYARRKPIAICEYAASHMAALDKRERAGFAADKASLLYGALPLWYPRVKMISWFNQNNLVHADPGRQLNNYNLEQQPALLQAYRRLIAPSYFLSGPEHLSDPRPPIARPLRDGATLSREGVLHVWAKSYVARPRLFVSWNGRVAWSSQSAGAHDVSLSRLNARGRGRLALYLYDDRNRFITSSAQTVTLR